MSSQEIMTILNSLPITDEERTGVQNSLSAATDYIPEFNFCDLEEKFSNVCTDYKTELQMDTIEDSRVVEFATKMIYEVGPEAIKVARSGGNYEYSFQFDKSVAVVSCTPSTSFHSEIKYDETTNSIHLSQEQAMLLAINTLAKVNKLFTQKPKPVHMFTRLAVAVFSKTDIDKMAEKLGVCPCDVVNIINASSEEGGQYLSNSSFACAAVCVLLYTKAVQDKNTKIKMISDTLGGYLKQNKKWDFKAYEVFTDFAYYRLGGKPSPEFMINMFLSSPLAQRAD